MNKYALYLKEKESTVQSLTYFKKAGDKGDIDSIYRYGMINFKGDGVPSNPKLGERFIRIACNNYHAEAIGQ